LRREVEAGWFAGQCRSDVLWTGFVPTTRKPRLTASQATMASASSKPSGDGGDSTVRSIVSLLLFIHLFCVAVVLASNFRRSRLQADLVRVFAAYTQLLNFDPDLTPYYYTLGRPSDDDASLVIDLYADADKPVAAQSPMGSVRLPDGGSNWSEDRKRYFRLAKMMAISADQDTENDDISGEIARSVAARLMRENQARRAVVRCIRRSSQPLNLSTLNPGYPADRPTDPAYDATVYEADVWFDEDDQVQALKRSSRAEVAPRQTGSQAPNKAAETKTP
jgi:hypothetical protein